MANIEQINYMAIPGLKFRDEMVFDSKNIIITICNHLGITHNQLKSGCRERDYFTSRHLCFYFLRKYTNETLSAIGKLFNKDHTTVIHGIAKINDFLEIRDRQTLRLVFELEELFVRKQNAVKNN